MTTARTIMIGRLALGLGATLAGGLAVGVATSFLQGVLPGTWNVLANSGAVWTVAGFLLATTVGTVLAGAVAGAVLAMLGEVAGYYAIASPLRHVATSHAEQALWTAAAVVVGSLAGIAAHSARTGTPVRRAAALGALTGVVTGEGLHALLRLGYTAQGWIEIGTGALGCAVVCTLVCLPRRAAAGASGPHPDGGPGGIVGAAVLAAAVLAGAVFAAYGT